MYLENKFHFVHADPHELSVDVKHSCGLRRTDLKQHVLEPVNTKDNSCVSLSFGCLEETT